MVRMDIGTIVLTHSEEMVNIRIGIRFEDRKIYSKQFCGFVS